MEFRNSRGVAVDPVPFLVTATTAFLVSFSFGPLYFRAVGFGWPPSLLLPTALFLLASAVAYRRFVRDARPDLRAELPPDVRLRRLFYAALVGIALLAGATLPLLAR